MIAWVSPSLMVRSTPLRISLGPSSVSTVTCRSRISRVLMSVLLLGSAVVERGGRVDEHVVALHAHGVDGDRLGGREAGRLAGAEVEARAVQPALDLAALDVALRQRDRGVRALVVDGEPGVAVADDAHRVARRRVEGGGQGRARLHVVDGAGALERHTFFSSSASTVASSFSSIAGTPILRTMSAKKPCTTRRRASSSGMPRACR